MTPVLLQAVKQQQEEIRRQQQLLEKQEKGSGVWNRIAKKWQS